MGGAVSSGRDNNELIDNLMGGNYIRSRCVERVFRVLDRADYMTPEARDQAYKDLAWRNGPLHMSAPCIYSEVMEGLELHPGLSFLNVGSGTGYLSTLVGLIIGSSGISHGIEVHPVVVEYAIKKLSQFIENSPTLDEFDYCEPKYYCGNGLCLAPLQAPYDRVYCGAGCPEEYQNYFKQLIKVGGILVMPLNDNLVQIRRVSETDWVSRSLLNVSFATLRVPTKEEAADLIRLDEQCPPKLQLLARSVIRSAMRAGLLRRHPELREPPQRAPPAKKSCPRRICIPIEDDSDVEGLNALHDLDRAGGAHEMNALLSLVLSMGQNRVAGALRFDSLDSPVDSSSDEEGEEAEGDGDEPGDDDDGGSAGGGSPRAAGSPPLRAPSPPPSEEGAPAAPRAAPHPWAGEEGPPTAPRPAVPPRAPPRPRRGLLTFEFRQTLSRARAAAPSTSAVASAALNDSATDTKSLETDGASSPSASVAASASASASRGKHDGRTDSKDDNPKSRTPNDADDSDSDSDNDRDNPGVPAEVEIYLGKANQASSSALVDMEWEEAAEDSSGEETQEETNTRKQDDKPQKLDSGIGEETTPTSDSSPLKSDSKSDDSKTDDSDEDGSRRSDSLTDDLDDPHQSSRRPKRGRWQSRSRASSSRSSGSGAARPRRQRRRPPPPPPPRGDARRVRLSIVMKRGVKELPLPYALKKFVNLGRCFEF